MVRPLAVEPLWSSPGPVTKSRGFPAFASAFRELKRIRPYLDAYVEVVDARAPASTRVPGLTKHLDPMAHLTVLSRRDLARESGTQRWLAVLAPAVAVDIRRLDPKEFLALLRRQAAAERLRITVLGAPNVGKSTLVNRLIGRRAARVGMVPGVTRGPQWIRGGALEVLDLPGLPSLHPTAVLQALGIVGEGAFPPEEALEAVWPYLGPSEILDPSEGIAASLERLGRIWGLLERGGRVSEGRTAQRLLGLLRRGDLGPVTVDRPEASS